jgi:hypothetical protein
MAHWDQWGLLLQLIRPGLLDVFPVFGPKFGNGAIAPYWRAFSHRVGQPDGKSLMPMMPLSELGLHWGGLHVWVTVNLVNW